MCVCVKVVEVHEDVSVVPFPRLSKGVFYRQAERHPNGMNSNETMVCESNWSPASGVKIVNTKT